MPLLKGPTFELNTSGLKVDIKKLMELRQTLQAECFEAKTIIYREIQPLIKFKYPGTSAKNTFNIGSTKQIAWLLFVACGEKFDRLTDAGRDLCRELNIKIPYSDKAKREFVADLISRKGQSYGTPVFSPKTGKMTRGKTVGDVWNYLSADKDTLSAYSNKYLWVSKLLEYTKNTKLLSTYVEGILERAEYGMIRPSFLQHGTTSGRYSSKNPNFQNLPRDDKRIKACIVSRPGMVFVGADYSQLEPRVFASLSGDERLQASFKNGDDFYSVIGSQVFNTPTASLKKDDEDSFAKKHPKLRNIAKTIALSATYGTTAPKMAATLDKSVKEAQEIIDDYFEAFPKVKEFMLKSHKLIMDTGVVYSAYGRARHMPEGKKIRAIYGNTPHKELPYEIRTMLNLSVNHVVQSTGASIMNRAAIEFSKRCKELAGLLGDWNDVKILLQVHDELVVEGPEGIKSDIALLLKDCMENTVSLPGVELKAEPAIGKNLAELK
jgi:DNA polymerase-1